jgi:hypothetical protein
MRNRSKREQHILVSAILCVATAGLTFAQETADVAETTTFSFEAFEEIASNENLVLYMNPESTEIALLDKRSDRMWWSNAPDRESDPLAKGIFMMDLASQLILNYVNMEDNQRFLKNTFTGSVRRQDFEVRRIPNGVRFSYWFPREEFRIPLEITLGEDYLQASVPILDIEEESINKVNSIAVLPNFGAGGASDQGYMLVPDGSGALIHFNNGKGRYQSYGEPIYGSDPVANVTALRERKESIRLPVFGIKNGNSALLGVVVSGDSIGTIRASVSGGRTSYSSVYVDFGIQNSDIYTYGTDEWIYTTLVEV